MGMGIVSDPVTGIMVIIIGWNRKDIRIGGLDMDIDR